jgi:transposase
MRAATPALPVSDEQRSVLEKLIRSHTAPHRDVQRARVLLMAADGFANTRIAREVGVSPATVAAWRERFAKEGLKNFSSVRSGRGRKPSIPAPKVEEIVRLTLHEKPTGQTHWSCRSMAERAGVSSSTVQRIWSARGLKPHRVETFKLSNDPRFEEKLVDVVGLYLNPPEKAIVLSMDEKSQIQALDRTQPSLPMKQGRAGTMTHDYKRHGTTTLFAALDVLTGKVIGQCLPRHRHTEFLSFLKTIDREVPRGLQIHMVLDNYATHSHPRVTTWLERHPRFHLHFTPTSSSWLNMVEAFFATLTDKAIRRGIFHSVPDLIAAIETYLAAHNENPQPFIWTATTEQILKKVRRGRVTLNTITSYKRDIPLAAARRGGARSPLDRDPAGAAAADGRDLRRDFANDHCRVAR